MSNMPKMKIGIVAVSRDCFPESLSVNRRKALVEAYAKKYDAADIYECPICIVESEIHMVQALEDIKKANKRTLEFAKYLQKRNQRTWIRYVVVPGYTDNDHDVYLLGQFIEGMTNIEKVELLPYHRLGAHKWKTLGFEYELADVLPPTKESLEHIKTILEGYGHTVKY